MAAMLSIDAATPSSRNARMAAMLSIDAPRNATNRRGLPLSVNQLVDLHLEVVAKTKRMGY